ncbi:cupin domain-containing protein [Streptomyces sp. NPDC090106]|uniref:cupin domain-containing protein n=1 Tax=Streptomyces sp. NPDC090106 TaxID=3365946 RepID=UPI003817C532
MNLASPTPRPAFPGSVGLSGLEVYPWPTADGLHGGSPHLHLTCTEGYVVVGGQGRLETLNHDEHAVHDLSAGDVVWFTPGTIHRAVNDGDLRVIVVMQNSGLPEAGDAVMTFPPQYLTHERYASTASVLGANGDPDPGRARARRDLAVEGFTELARQWDRGNRQPLADFHAAAAGLVTPRLREWTQTVTDGALAAAQDSLRQIDALSRGDHSYLTRATVSSIGRPDTQSLGMCGLLHAYDSLRRAGGPQSA